MAFPGYPRFHHSLGCDGDPCAAIQDGRTHTADNRFCDVQDRSESFRALVASANTKGSFRLMFEVCYRLLLAAIVLDIGLNPLLLRSLVHVRRIYVSHIGHLRFI